MQIDQIAGLRAGAITHASPTIAAEAFVSPIIFIQGF
jgi:hypothetical protein